MCICLSIIRPKYPSLSWSTVSRVYPVAVCEAFALKLRVGIAKVSFGRRLILPLHVVVRRSILSANMSKRSEPTKNRASAVAPYIPALKDEVLRRVPMMGRYGHMNFMRIPKRTDHEAVTEALTRVGMIDFRHRQIGELSGGQRKRVFLARALAQEGKVILLDEPFTGVDVTTEDVIIALLRDMRDEGRVILVATHNLGSVPEFCDRTVLVKGTVLAHGPTSETFTQSNLEEAFGGVLRHFVLTGKDLHDDDDTRQVTVLTDDERPFVLYDDKPKGSEVEGTK